MVAVSHKSVIILVVDDEPAVLGFLTGTLSRTGYRVVQAESADQALRVCRDRGHSIDLILTDVVMPGLNGCELVEAIRGLGFEPRTLFMSGYHRDVALDSGIADTAQFIQKPFTPAQLVKKVKEVLGAPAAAAASGGTEQSH
jgi:two-component system, cell cycle sensor histidine kinase and response regulator CckA